jgi:uncharacterized integral membrane protein
MQRKSFSLWGFVIAALILVFFSVQNAQEVSFRFFVWRSHLSLSVLLIVAFLLGLVAGAVFSFRSSKAKKEKSNEKELKKQENDQMDDGLHHFDKEEI